MGALGETRETPSRGNSEEDKELENEVIETIENVAPVESAPTQKMLDAERVNDLIKKAKMEGYEKAKREAASEMAKTTQQPAVQEQVAAESGDDISKLVDERLARIAQEHQLRVEREAEEQRLRKIANSYFEKMEKGPELFEDFEEVMSKFKAHKNADIIELAHEFDNLPQVMYELAKNPLKAVELRILAKDDKDDALYELQRLSRSIAQNEEAQNQYVPARPPLTKPKPSHVGTDSGKMTLEDYKNAAWNRF